MGAGVRGAKRSWSQTAVDSSASATPQRRTNASASTRRPGSSSPSAPRPKRTTAKARRMSTVTLIPSANEVR